MYVPALPLPSYLPHYFPPTCPAPSLLPAPLLPSYLPHPFPPTCPTPSLLPAPLLPSSCPTPSLLLAPPLPSYLPHPFPPTCPTPSLLLAPPLPSYLPHPFPPMYVPAPPLPSYLPHPFPPPAPPLPSYLPHPFPPTCSIPSLLHTCPTHLPPNLVDTLVEKLTSHWRALRREDITREEAEQKVSSGSRAEMSMRGRRGGGGQRLHRFAGV